MIGSIAIEKIRSDKDVFIGLAQNMWDHPETGYNEVKACELTAEILKN